MSHSRRTKPTVLYQEGAFQEFSNKQLEHIFAGDGPFLETAPAKTQFLKAYGTYDYEHKPAKENKFKPVKVNVGPDYAVKSDFPKGPGGSEVPAWLWKDGDQEKVVKQLHRTSEEMLIPHEWVKPKNTLKYSDLGGGGPPGMPPGAGKAVEMMVGNIVAQREADKEDALRRAMLERGVNPEEATKRVMERRAETARIDLERGRRTEEQRRREMLRQFAPTIEARAERERIVEEEIGGARTARQTAEEEARRRAMAPPRPPAVALARARAGLRGPAPPVDLPPPVGGAGIAGGAGGLVGGGAVRRAVEEAMAGEGEAGGAEGIMRGGGGGGRGGARVGAGRKALPHPTKKQIRKELRDSGIIGYSYEATRDIDVDELVRVLRELDDTTHPGIFVRASKQNKN